MHHPWRSFQKAILILSIGVAPALVAAPSPIQERADRFLALVNAGYKGLYRVSSEAQWLAVMAWLEKENKGRQIGWD